MHGVTMKFKHLIAGLQPLCWHVLMKLQIMVLEKLG